MYTEQDMRDIERAEDEGFGCIHINTKDTDAFEAKRIYFAVSSRLSILKGEIKMAEVDNKDIALKTTLEATKQEESSVYDGSLEGSSTQHFKIMVAHIHATLHLADKVEELVHLVKKEMNKRYVDAP